MTAQAEEAYRTVQELAEAFHVSKWTIYRRYKKWPHSTVGGIRFSPEDVAHIKRLIHAPAPQPLEVPAHSPAQLARAAQRLGLPAPRKDP
jgi:hypothetical protein